MSIAVAKNEPAAPAALAAAGSSTISVSSVVSEVTVSWTLWLSLPASLPAVRVMVKEPASA